jgi:hypothetical protein
MALSGIHRVCIQLMLIVLVALVGSVAWTGINTTSWTAYYAVKFALVVVPSGFVTFYLLVDNGTHLYPDATLTEALGVNGVRVLWAVFVLVYAGVSAGTLYAINPFEFQPWLTALSISIGHVVACAVIGVVWMVALRRGGKSLNIWGLLLAAASLLVPIYQFAFSMTFGYWFEHASPAYQVAMCASYPVAIGMIKSVSIKLMRSDHDELHLYLFFLAAVPYRLLFTLNGGLSWTVVVLIATVEVVYKIITYAFVLTDGALKPVLSLKRFVMGSEDKSEQPQGKIYGAKVKPSEDGDAAEEKVALPMDQNRFSASSPSAVTPHAANIEHQGEQADVEGGATTTASMDTAARLHEDRIKLVHVVAKKFFMQSYADIAAILAIVSVIIVHDLGPPDMGLLIAKYSVLFLVELCILSVVPFAKRMRKLSDTTQAFDVMHQGEKIIERSNLPVITAVILFSFIASFFFLDQANVVPIS